MLQDEGKLNVADPVAKYLPEFAALKTPSGKPANLTITQILTHTSGLGEASGPAAQQAKTLADLVPIWLAAPMQYEPGAKWKYTQSGINAARAHRRSRERHDASMRSSQKRLFDPLGMKNTTFYPTDAQRARLVTAYAKNKDTGALEPVPPRAELGPRDRPPQGNGGLYSTRARLRAVLPDAAQRRHARRPPLPERRRHEIPHHAADRRPADRLLPERHLRQSRHELRLGHRHLRPAHAARRRGGDAFARHATATAARGARRRGSIRSRASPTS